jgi:hypothetical protein
MKSQADQILAYLKTGKPLDPMTALGRFGCFRLAARCHDLRAEGYPIRSEMITDVKTGKRYAVYWLA